MYRCYIFNKFEWLKSVYLNEIFTADFIKKILEFALVDESTIVCAFTTTHHA